MEAFRVFGPLGSPWEVAPGVAIPSAGVILSDEAGKGNLVPGRRHLVTVHFEKACFAYCVLRNAKLRGSSRKSTLLQKFAQVTSVNEPCSLLGTLAQVQFTLCLQMSRYVYKCIRMSRQIPLFGTLFCGLAHSPAPSLTDTERAIFYFRALFLGLISQGNIGVFAPH